MSEPRTNIGLGDEKQQDPGLPNPVRQVQLPKPGPRGSICPGVGRSSVGAAPVCAHFSVRCKAVGVHCHFLSPQESANITYRRF